MIQTNKNCNKREDIVSSIYCNEQTSALPHTFACMYAYVCMYLLNEISNDSVKGIEVGKPANCQRWPIRSFYSELFVNTHRQCYVSLH